MNSLNYAIVEDGIVTNIIWLFPGTEFPNAVPYGELPVHIGDTYENGKFYRDGVEVGEDFEKEDMAEALNILGVAP